MTGWTWFPFDVVDWLSSDDVTTMTAAERGVYITLLCIQWRDGYVPSRPQTCAKVSGFRPEMIRRWFAKWAHLFPISSSNAAHLVNAKLLKIAVEVANPKAERGTEERRVEESTEKILDSKTDRESVSQSVSQLVVVQQQQQEDKIEDLFSEETPEVQTLFSLLYPSGFSSANLFLEEVPHARACIALLEKNVVYVPHFIEYNRSHKSGGLVFRSCAQLHKALSADEQRALNDYTTHDEMQCVICKRIAKGAKA